MYGMANRFDPPDQTKVTIRCNEDLVDAYDETLGDQSRSAAIREHMRERAGKTTEDDLPDNDLLREGLQAIREAADPDGHVPTTVAKSRVAESTRVKTDDSIRTVIRPLRERGFIEIVTYGKLRVVESVGGTEADA
jgi:hypothetical protein